MNKWLVMGGLATSLLACSGHGASQSGASSDADEVLDRLQQAGECPEPRNVPQVAGADWNRVCADANGPAWFRLKTTHGSGFGGDPVVYFAIQSTRQPGGDLTQIVGTTDLVYDGYATSMTVFRNGSAPNSTLEILYAKATPHTNNEQWTVHTVYQNAPGDATTQGNWTDQVIYTSKSGTFTSYYLKRMRFDGIRSVTDPDTGATIDSYCAKLRIESSSFFSRSTFDQLVCRTANGAWREYNARQDQFAAADAPADDATQVAAAPDENDTPTL